MHVSRKPQVISKQAMIIADEMKKLVSICMRPFAFRTFAFAHSLAPILLRKFSSVHFASEYSFKYHQIMILHIS